jgi:HlyD family secretion protein
MTATIDFVISRVEEALLVPNAALRFQPPEGAADTSPAAASGSEGTGRIYTLDAGGRLLAIAVSRGETDGVRTVVSGSDLHAGLEVISGLQPEERQVSKNFFSFLRPQRPAGGGMR